MGEGIGTSSQQQNFVFELSKHSSLKSKKSSCFIFVRSNRNISVHFIDASN